MRRTRELKIEGDPEKNRDAGKTFLITEVDAVQSEEWGLRALMALGTGGITVPQEMADAGLMGVALVSYQAFMGAREDAVLPLWREMLPMCVKQYVSAEVVHPWHPTLVEEVSTLMKLRQQIMELHTGFTLAEIAQKLKAATLALQSNSQTTSTSPAPSEPLSPSG